MIRNLLLALILGLWLTVQAFAQESPRLFKTITAVGCCELDLELTILAEALAKEPDSQPFFVGYGGQGDSPGKVLRYLEYIKRELPSALNKNSYPITIINGGYREEFSIEIWIAPKGTSSSTLIGSEWSADYFTPFKFDELSVTIIDWPDNTSRLSFGELCTLSYPNWAEVFDMLRNNSGSRVHIIVYAGIKEKSRRATRLIRFLRAELNEYYPQESKRVTIEYGGKSKEDWSEIDIWYVPDGGMSPKPTVGNRKSSHH
jgi:hypothetical protein